MTDRKDVRSFRNGSIPTLPDTANTPHSTSVARDPTRRITCRTPYKIGDPPCKHEKPVAKALGARETMPTDYDRRHDTDHRKHIIRFTIKDESEETNILLRGNIYSLKKVNSTKIAKYKIFGTSPP